MIDQKTNFLKLKLLGTLRIQGCQHLCAWNQTIKTVHVYLLLLVCLVDANGFVNALHVNLNSINQSEQPSTKVTVHNFFGINEKCEKEWCKAQWPKDVIIQYAAADLTTSILNDIKTAQFLRGVLLLLFTIYLSPSYTRTRCY